MTRITWLRASVLTAALPLGLAACAIGTPPLSGELYSGFTLVDPIERTVTEDA